MNDETFFLQGTKVILRPLKKEDIGKKYLAWVNDQEVVQYMDTGAFPSTLKQLRNYHDGVAASGNDLMLAIVNKKTNSHIGNIKLGGINWIHRFAHLGIMIGDKRFWGRGYGQEACALLLRHAFDRLNLNKIILGVCAKHDKAIRTYKKAGFKIEGRLKGMFNFNDRYLDKIVMGISRHDFIG